MKLPTNGSGGVFFGRKYTTNFTVADTVFTCNSAGNGVVFYVRRFNSSVKIICKSTFLENTASNRGGVMNLGGVTLTMDMDTVIANNTAGSYGNVISACVSEITAYGLDTWLDPVYPLYCSIYDEGNSSYPTTQSITTDSSMIIVAGSTTEHLETTTHHERTATASAEKSTTMVTNIPSMHTTDSPSNTTPQPTSIEKITTSAKIESNPQFTDSPTVKTGTQSNVDKVMPTSEESTHGPAATVTVTVA